ncbi:MAG: chitooligosaccharide deacetylase [Candidatus Saccharibacteria bacterium]|nr:chitooligosaccharide deacetylase [Candidatus Saccharibacteria bacterium]
MCNDTRHNSNNVLIGLVAILAAVVLALGFLALLTLLSYHKHVTYTHAPMTLGGTHDLITPDRSPTVQKPLPSIVPDAHIGPVTGGLAPVVTSLHTNQPIVFLTIDDGAHKAPDELQALKDNGIKATLFLARAFINDNPDFFIDYAKAGYPIEDHTLSHDINMVKNMNYEQQKQEICGMADYEQQHYGRRPTFFRPPGGAYSNSVRRAAADCGMKAVVTWIAKANGGSMQYQIGDHLRSGDVVLMHFRPEFQQDLKAFIDAADSQHLRTELLQNWL